MSLGRGCRSWNFWPTHLLESSASAARKEWRPGLYLPSCGKLSATPPYVINVAQALFATTQYRDLQERSIDLLFGRVFGPPPPEEVLLSRTYLTTM